MHEVHFQYKRQFQLWFYTVSHGQLLLRSTKSDDSPTRIDIFFKNTKYLCLPGFMLDLCIRELKSIPPFEGVIAMEPIVDQIFFEVTGENYRGFVIASAVFLHEDEGEYNDPSFFNILYNRP